MIQDRKFYVYAHRKASNGNVFYIGKGKKGRSRAKCSRSPFWHSTVAKHGLIIEDRLGPVPEPCSFTFEKILINAIGVASLCNLSTGGDGGMSGYKFDRNVVAAKAKKCMKHVINSNGEVFSSLKDAAQKMRSLGYLNATESHISSCCHGRRHVAYGLSWSFAVGKIPELIDASAKVNEKRLRPVRASNGMIFKGVSSAAAWVNSELGIKCGTSDISRCCNGIRKVCAGLKWEYVS